MTCAIDHAIDGTIPAFLCRGCNPGEFKAWPTSYRPATERAEKPRAKVIEKIVPQKVVPEEPLDLDDLKQVVIHKRPGITTTLMQMMQRKEGASRAEMRAELLRLHPDRNPAGMYSTIQRQSRELSTSKREDAQRGTVYYVVVEE